MISLSKSGDSDGDGLLDTYKYLNDELKLPPPLTPEPSSSLNSSENSCQHKTPVTITIPIPSDPSEDDDEIIELKSQIQKLEAELTELKTNHEHFIENSKLKVTFLEHENAELKDQVAEKGQVIRDMAGQYENLQNTMHSYENDSRLEELEHQNSILLAENLAYDIQITEMKDQLYYRDAELARTKSELTNQRGLNNELLDKLETLNIQMTEWQVDFIKEREDRCALASDRETILTQLKNEQCLNEQLEHHRRDLVNKGSNSCTCM